MKLKLLLVTCFTFLTSLLVKANGDAPPTGNDNTAIGDSRKNDINGNVFNSDSKKPIRNVNVTAYLSSRKEKIAVTNGNGIYAFDDLKPGVYRFVFEKDGFRQVTKERVVIKTDEAFQLNIEMIENADFDFFPGIFTF